MLITLLEKDFEFLTEPHHSHEGLLKSHSGAWDANLRPGGRPTRYGHALTISTKQALRMTVTKELV